MKFKVNQEGFLLGSYRKVGDIVEAEKAQMEYYAMEGRVSEVAERAPAAKPVVAEETKSSKTEPSK